MILFDNIIGGDIIKIPLIATTNINENGDQELEVWTNGTKKTVDIQLLPYFISKK